MSSKWASDRIPALPIFSPNEAMTTWVLQTLVEGSGRWVLRCLHWQRKGWAHSRSPVSNYARLSLLWLPCLVVLPEWQSHSCHEAQYVKDSPSLLDPSPTCLLSLLSHYPNNLLLGSLPNGKFSSLSRLPTFKDFNVVWLITVERHIATRGQSELTKQLKNRSHCHPLSPGLHRKKKRAKKNAVSSLGLFYPDASFLHLE